MTVLLPEQYARRARELTFIDAVRFFPYAAGWSAGLSIALVEYKVWRTPHFAYVPIVVTWALVGLVLSLILSAFFRHMATAWPAWLSRGGAASWLLALDLGILFLPLPVLLLVKSLPEEDMTGWLWPLVNKRWLLALYNLAITTFVLFPVAIERWRSHSNGDRDATNRVLERPAVRPHALSMIAGGFLVLAICWYAAGMPWHLDRHHRSIEWHEQMHFGALQAISKGYLPAVGPAASAYGPGAQLLTYGIAKLTGALDFVSIRQAWVAQQLLALLVVGMAAYWWLGVMPAIAIVCLAVMYSPMAFFYTLADGTYTGFFGWANPLRYVAPLIVVPTLAVVATQDTKALAVVWLGAVWGLGAWLAQESLTTTATAVALLLALLCLTQTMTVSRAVWVVRNLVVGFACVIVPVLGYYAAHGAAITLVRTYFTYPRAVAAGFGNDWWPPQDSASLARLSYYFTSPFLIGCAICALWRLPGLQLVMPLDRSRTRFLAFVCVQFVCYQTALLRSDSSHLMNSMMALPFVLVLGFMDVPRWLATRSAGQWSVRAGFVLLALTVYPSFGLAANVNGLGAPARRFQTTSAVSQAPAPDGIAITRMRPLAPDEPLFLGDPPMTVREFATFATELRAIVGGRKTYCLRIEWIAGGLIAFVADLTPAPHPLAGDLFTFNDLVRTQVANHIRAHPDEYEAFIGPSLTDPEARAFLSSHPDARTMRRRLGNATVYILVSGT